MELSRRDFFKGAGLVTVGAAVAATGFTLPSGREAFAEVVGRGTIGLSFGEQKAVLVGQTISGTVYSYDIGGADSFHLTFEYDSTVFGNVAVVAPQGITILATEDTGSRLDVVFSADPTTTDYRNLLTVQVTANTTEGEGAVTLAYAAAAKLGGTVELTNANDDNTLFVKPAELGEFTVETLSLAMTFYMVDTASPRWAEAARFDLSGDGLIDIVDFIKIANAILDATSKIKLKFREDGSFTILQVSDYQDHLRFGDRAGYVHPRSVELFNAMLDDVQPDVVIMTGDNLTGDMNGTEMQEYIRQMMLPCEDREIPWFVTFGNHDEDPGTALAEGWNKIRQLDYYRSFSANINRASMSGCVKTYSDGHSDCVGDMYTLVYDAEGTTPLYNLWGFDSNRYQRGEGIGRPRPYQNLFQSGTWAWIKSEQVAWYINASTQIENRYGKLNSLMFFHIPLQEWSNMVSEHAKFGATGLRGEGECPGNINSGLFTAAFERGDVKGMFVGHDHINDYAGTYYGIMLAYDASIGYATYGGEMKGGRVIELNTADLSTFTTRMVYAQDYGLGTSWSQPTVAQSMTAAGF
jgi:3',5'-cyclic AMP phosphodiesterase CpdA